jgi:acyl carrier protein
VEKQAFLLALANVLQVSPEAIHAGLALTPENWDSVAVLATIALIDEQTGVTVPTKELKACTSVGAVVDLVQRTVV